MCLTWTLLNSMQTGLSDSMLNSFVILIVIMRDVGSVGQHVERYADSEGCWICLTACCTLGMLDLSDSMLYIGDAGSV